MRAAPQRTRLQEDAAGNALDRVGLASRVTDVGGQTGDRAKIAVQSPERVISNRTQRVHELQLTGRGVWIALTSAIFWAASLVAMLAGGYVVAVGTPCLCADVNGFMLGGGLVIILASAGMLLWSRELARLVVDRLTRLATQQK